MSIESFDLAELEQTVLFPEERTAVEQERGILASQHIEQLIRHRMIDAGPGVDPSQVQPASLDLRLGPVAYRVSASFLPGEQGRVMPRARDLTLETIDLTTPAVLEQGGVYIVPLLETLALPEKTWARANPKSTTGRLDVFTRLLVDYAAEFDRVPEAYTGDLYVEVVPRTFAVAVRQGTRLNQLRFVRGNRPPADRFHQDLHDESGLLFHQEGERPDADIRKGVWVSVDLAATHGDVIGYRAIGSKTPIDLDRIGAYDPAEFWEPIAKGPGRLILERDAFYILVSKERVRVPVTAAADMVPYDPSVGEYRVHYAGFFDPGFGCGSTIRGTPAVLEVRSHEVPFLLEDGQKVARLVYEELLSPPAKVYGQGIGSSYQGQGLKLAKQFRAPPSR